MPPLSPLNGSADVSLLKTFDSATLIRQWQKDLQIDISAELEGVPQIELYRCNQTGLKFFRPVEVTGSGGLYQQLQKYDWYYLAGKWEHQVALEDLAGAKNILEIGSGSGAFVKAAQRAGLTIRGLELNEAAVAQAQKEKLPLERLDLEQAAQLYPGAFDAVCSFQVLEHVPEPGQFITQALQLLKPGGSLILSVPNDSSYLAHEDSLLNTPPHHMSRWSEATFAALEKLFPLKLEKTRREHLTPQHVKPFLSSYNGYWRAKAPLAKLLSNRYTLPVYEQVLKLGLRQFFTGHTLYVKYSKS